MLSEVAWFRLVLLLWKMTQRRVSKSLVLLLGKYCAALSHYPLKRSAATEEGMYRRQIIYWGKQRYTHLWFLWLWSETKLSTLRLEKWHSKMRSKADHTPLTSVLITPALQYSLNATTMYLKDPKLVLCRPNSACHFGIIIFTSKDTWPLVLPRVVALIISETQMTAWISAEHWKASAAVLNFWPSWTLRPTWSQFRDPQCILWWLSWRAFFNLAQIPMNALEDPRGSADYSPRTAALACHISEALPYFNSNSSIPAMNIPPLWVIACLCGTSSTAIYGKFSIANCVVHHGTSLPVWLLKC